jgi:hypothetical protein
MNDFHEDVPFEHVDQDSIEYKMYPYMPFVDKEIMKRKQKSTIE